MRPGGALSADYADNMASNFPSQLDSLTNPSPTQSLDDPTVDHAAQHANANDAIEAIEARIGIAGTTDAASLEKRLMQLTTGKGGGQTLIGGTNSSDALTLQGTTASGTTGGGNALIMRSGDAGNTQAMTITNDATVAVGPASANAKLRVGPAPGVSISPVALGVGNNAGEFWEVFSTNSAAISNATVGLNTLPINPSANTFSVGASIFVNNTSDNTYRYTAGSFNVESISTNVGTLSSLRGFSALAKHGAPGALSSMYGFLGTAYNYSAATITTMYGAFIGTYNYLAGTVTNQIGIYINSEGTANGSMGSLYGLSVRLKVGSGGTATNAYGITLGGSSGWTATGGTLTNCYVLHIAASTNMGTNKWAIYSLSPAQSYLEGSLGLGVTTPSAKVHALASTEQLRLGYDAANYASFTVSSAGVPTLSATGVAWGIVGDLRLDKTVTASGTNGAQTINKTSGSVNFAAAATSLVVTNSLVTTNSVILATAATNDSTLKSVAVVAAAGSFTLYANAAATSATRVNFLVLN